MTTTTTMTKKLHRVNSSIVMSLPMTTPFRPKKALIGGTLNSMLNYEDSGLLLNSLKGGAKCII